MTPEKIHKLADRLSIKWDNNKEFMDWSEKITGKRHLDDMDSGDLLKIYLLLMADKYPKEQTNEDDLYLHRAVSQYVTPKRTERLKNVLKRVYVKNDKEENPKYIPLTSLANRIRKRISTKYDGE